ncbi:hypothetical protein K3495_g2800 [Podosphaera aphanis]|nr:hypothetical protein K3495_g2800 [Podosphaera aphanis]
MSARRGKPDEELFLHRPPSTNDEDIPTIKPLRIHKSNIPDSLKSGRPGYNTSSEVLSSKTVLPYPVDLDEYISEHPRIHEHRPHSAPYPEDSGELEFSLEEQGFRKKQHLAGHNIIPSPYSADSITLQPLVHTPKKKTDLEVRRTSISKPLPDLPDKEGLYVKQPSRVPEPQPSQNNEASQDSLDSNASTMIDTDSSVPTTVWTSRVDSTASMSTTRASRGSPPPTFTPMMGPGDSSDGVIQAGISHAGNLATVSQTNSHVRPEFVVQKTNHDKCPRVPQTPEGNSSPSAKKAGTSKPSMIAELPDSKFHEDQTVFQGLNQVIQSLSPPPQGGRTQVHEQETSSTHLSPSPPPAYSCLTLGVAANTQVNSSIKRARIPSAIHANSNTTTTAAPVPVEIQHPASAKNSDSRPISQVAVVKETKVSSTALGPSPNSPPPLPEGWISHIDKKSGQYYYIHLQTQTTQWEFPKGPTPLNHEAASLSPSFAAYGNPLLSPSLNGFGKIPLTSPGFHPYSPGYADILGIASQSPTVAGFTSPPPNVGVDLYKIAPTNGVYFGPYLRYINMDIEKGIWYGSILLLTSSPQPPTIHIHQSKDLSPNPRQLKPNPIFTHQKWIFYRYDIDLQMSDEVSIKWTYAVTSHLGCTRYEFIVAGHHETNWKIIAHSGNDFSMNTNASERSKLGGIGYMWKDILQKNIDCRGFHVQLGLGDQIYGDRMWKEILLLKQWLAISGKENRKSAAWTARHEEEISHAYFHYYTSHFDQPYLREAFAQIPSILQINDHDIFDGFGSYPEYMQSSNIFKNIGRVAIEMYLLFQHHTTMDLLRKRKNDMDLFTITGSGWHFLKYLGPAMVVIGPDCRSERNEKQVLAGPTYQGLFPKVANLPSNVQHCIWMISVPIVYPRLDSVESFAHTITTAKKGVTGTYNLLGRMTSSVAGVIGGKQAVASGFSQVKKVVGKSGLMGGVLNPFGDIDIADDLRDMWTHESKDLERTYLIRTLQGISRQKGIRMTFLSGDVTCCGVGLLHDPSQTLNHKTMYQIISSAVVAAPLPNYALKIMHNAKALYVPANGERSTNAVSNTKEDMLEIFQTETSGGPRELKKLMGRRNYVTFVPFDPEAIAGKKPAPSTTAEQPRLSLAVDFIVQGEGTLAKLAKYGPVVIPGLEYGR